MPLQDWCYLFYKNVKRKSFSNDVGIRGKNRAKEFLTTSLVLWTSSCCFSTWISFLLWVQFLIEAFHWYLPLFDLRLNLSYLSSKWSLFLFFFKTDAAWKALKPIRTIIKCTFINVFEVCLKFKVIMWSLMLLDCMLY